MKTRLLSLLLLPIVVFHLSGCTSARELTLPGGAGDPERPDVSEGETVTVYLVDGEHLSGKVIAVSPDTLTLGVGGNYGWDETSIPADRIARVEIDEATTLAKTLMVVAGVAVMAVMVIGIIVSTADIPDLS